MIATHAFTLNGRVSMNLTDSIRPIPAAIARCLGNLDGVEQFAYALWRLPENKSLDQVSDADMGTYLQCAGSAERMTIEMREERGSEVRHYTVGRRNDRDELGSGEPIRWSDFSVVVFPNEIFTFTEAAEIFFYYYSNDAVPAGYTVRPL